MATSLLRYTTREGDRWDLIAHRYYGNALMIGDLIAANPHLPVAESFAAGLTVYVPVLAQQPNNRQGELPPWLRTTSV